jgi:phosphoribosyl 1,2-cyclic phosphodiesterase
LTWIKQLAVTKLDEMGAMAANKTRRTNRLSLTFLGTRGEIEARSRLHRRHSALLVRLGRSRVMIDCGADWLNQIAKSRPTAIVLTHAHPDHAHGLAHGAPCPVYATRTTWKLLPAYPVRERRTMPMRKPVLIGGIRLEAFPVEHSLRAPAVGYRIAAGSSQIFYVPDVLSIRHRRAALRGIGLYIGDGAVIARSLIRIRQETPIGHAAVRRQLAWCRTEKVPAAIFTHCGSEIVKGNAKLLDRLIREMGAEYGVSARIAHDGQRLRFTQPAAIGRVKQRTRQAKP